MSRGVHLHARAEEHRLTLLALQQALETEGARCRLSGPGSVAEALPERVGFDTNEEIRVEVISELAAVPRERPAEPVPDVLVLDDARALDPEVQLPPWITETRLLIVPGDHHARVLEGRLRGRVRALGLPRLDPLFQSPERARERARAELGISGDTVLVLLETGEPLPGPEAPCLASDTIVALRPASPSGALCESLRALAAARPGLVLWADLDPTLALAAADSVVAPAGRLELEARLVGRRVVELADPTDWCGALERALGGLEAPSEPPAEQLAERGRAALSVAKVVCELDARAPVDPQTASEPPPAATGRPISPGSGDTGRGESLDPIRARAAFGDAAGAVLELRAALEQRPDAEGFELLARLEREREDLASAETALCEAERLARSRLASTLCERGRLAVARGDLAPARVAFEQANAVDAGCADARVGLGSLALQAGDASTALSHFERALESEDSSRAHSGIGLARLALDRAAEALDPLERALDREPDCLAAIYGLVQAGFQTGALERAERRAARFVELHPGNLDISFTLAGIKSQLGDLEGARELCERIALFDADYEGLAELRAKLRG